VFVSLALIYLSPDTAENQELRQSLSYFFPAYSYSSPAHQHLMQKVGGPCGAPFSSPYDIVQLGLLTRVRSTEQGVQRIRRRSRDGLARTSVRDVYGLDRSAKGHVRDRYYSVRTA
jgi:hypothetical protein